MLTILFCVLCAACSVKEDRSECPCRLYVFLRGNFEAPVDLVLRDSDGARAMLLFEGVPLADSSGLWCGSVEVSRLRYDVLAVSGISAALAGSELSISPGQQMPPLWTSHKVIDTRSESVVDTLELYKQYCRLSLKMKSHAASDDGNVCLRICGRVNGVSIADGAPLEGEFEVRGESGALQMSANVPRQKDSSLSLKVERGSDVYEFPLGRAMAAAGYNWADKSLSDCLVEVDMSASSIQVLVSGWESTEPVTVTI